MTHRSMKVPIVVVWLLEGVLFLFLFGVMSYFISQHVQDEVSAKNRSQSIAGCERNQVPRGYLQLRAQEFVTTEEGNRSTTSKLANDYFRIVDCGATFAGDNASGTIYLSPQLEDCFNELLRTRGFGHNAENVTTDPQRLHTEFDCT